MAIYSAVPPPAESPTTTTTTTTTTTAAAAEPQAHPVAAIDIEAWTIQALQSLSVSPVARGTGTPLSIPLDDHHAKTDASETRQVSLTIRARQTTPTPRPRSARDSQRRRELLQKGNEGSRQRRRWENDRLIGVPNAQPPLAADWELRPTHRVQHVPYHVAQFWDRGVRQRAEDKAAALEAARRRQKHAAGSGARGTATGLKVGQVPRDLRESARRKPAVRGWVRVLEEPVRQFLQEQQKQHLQDDKTADDTTEDEVDSEDEEIVFVGRKAGQARTQWKKAHREVGDEKVDQGMVFDSLGDDETAVFRRWLTHSISDYYGLQSHSVTIGNPARRVVYVSVKSVAKQVAAPVWKELPKPLWEVC